MINITEKIKGLVRSTWVDYFTSQHETLETIPPEDKKEYVDAMLLLENDENFMREIIG